MSVFILKKRLSKTDVEHRLSFPSRKLGHLPLFPEGGNRVGLVVRVGSEARGRVLHCRTRRSGRYRKPVIEAGWKQIVKEKELKEGDWVEFYKETNRRGHGHVHAHYTIKVNRQIKLMGKDIVSRVV